LCVRKAPSSSTAAKIHRKRGNTLVQNATGPVVALGHSRPHLRPHPAHLPRSSAGRGAPDLGRTDVPHRDKIFGAYIRHADRPTLTCKVPEGSQAVLVGADPTRFFVPHFVGHIGWVGMWLDGKVDWDEVARLVERSYRMTAPKRLAVAKRKSAAAKAKKARSKPARRRHAV
jgi:predicted DNA-binding protein (MmcQ/YjbR family)